MNPDGTPDSVPGLLTGGDQMSPEQQRYLAFANLPDETMTRVGIPLGDLRNMIQQNESSAMGGYDALAWAKGQTPNAMSLPTSPTGFPQWGGAQGKLGYSHGAGAYQFEPELWNEFAPGMGITDFSRQSQDAVANAAIMRYGLAPWNTNTKLAQAVRQYHQQQPAGPPGLLAPSYSRLWQVAQQ